ncbi:hypothetical protein [Taibaiella chishuiensis]|uniref:Uncharacterized protein n=1 Tax=Taibaiella chishuiensis TaxID=1434707 RepID=A0A2P8D9Y9_9BACT|nr:hypothetical protein [Taibaiella chishuiensis]PSK94034.1 hypothetical protein B0I18_101184 [Taibaiella chishuiensis]
MKNFLLTLLVFCTGPLFVTAQHWRINGYKDTAAITIVNEGKEVKVQSGATAATFPLHSEGQLLRLKSSAENERLLRLVKVDAARIDKEYHDLDRSLLAGEKLINKANTFAGKKLMIVPEGYNGGPDENVDETANNNGGEAGGVNETPAADDGGNLWKDNWMTLLLAALGVALVSALLTRMLVKNKKAPEAAPVADPEPVAVAAAGKEPKGNAAELKKVKQELAAALAELEQLQATHADLEKKLNVNRSFDSSYFNEAFRKLVAPMHEALESGSRKDTLEAVLKMAMHFSSLTRYKIAKKQAFDEANIYYLLNQKAPGAEVAVTEIDRTTPEDKIPKNIRTVTDLLHEQGSAGLDDTILSGYRIKNL